MGQNRPFSFFQIPILQQINDQNNIRHLETNSRPFEYESPPITTRPDRQLSLS